MSRYTPIPATASSPSSPTSRRSLSSLRRPSISSFRFGSSRDAGGRIPDPDEMDAAFDGPEDDGETHGLLGRDRRESDHGDDRVGHIPGDYDFERDYTQPPSSPPPFQPYSSHNPAPGNTNGIIPTDPVRPPQPPSRHFLGGILPSSFLPRDRSASPRVVGAGRSGIFGNLSARPDGQREVSREGTGDYVPELEQKEGPPSYQAAMRDAVPPYWDTTVVLPSSQSPFGPLTSSMAGDEILIDGMPSGNFFGFFWNMIVSFSFQFVGFLLTYVLHTTHSAKYGSRVGLGFTLIQFGLSIRAKANELLETGKFPTDPSDPTPTPSNMSEDEAEAENALHAFWGPSSPWPATIQDPLLPAGAPPVVLHNTHEAELYAQRHNTTLSGLLDLPSARDVGRANEYFSFMLMSIGWFLVLTSLGGWWRVKRFERGLRRAQRDSEAAQAAAAANRGEGANDAEPDANNLSTSSRRELSPRELAYYTAPLAQAWDGVREIQRGFFGMNGRRLAARRGHQPLSQEDDGQDGAHELLDAQGFGLGPMAAEQPSGERRRGLWS